jgi:hypothetical protein
MAGMSSLGMSKLKALLQDQVIQMGGTGSVSSADVIEALRKAHPSAIKEVSRELEDGQLHRILSQLAGRSPKEKGNEPDLFSDYSGVHQFIGIEIERDGHRVVEWKPIGATTLKELSSWLESDRKSSTTRRQRETGMVKMLRDLSKVAQGHTELTVAEALALRTDRKKRKPAA